MPIKNQTDSVYSKEKSDLKKKLVIGVSGGVDSLVAAYLLKIQKFDLFAVVVLPAWDEFSGNKSGILSCAIDDNKIQFIKEFCHQLKIPLEIVKTSGEFLDSVVETWMESKLTGTLSSACWSCLDLRMKILYKKMKDFEADGIATGHYAKIFHHAGHDTFYIHSSNDEEFDQSSHLSRVPKEIIRVLHLPLSDLQKKEVLKLAENFGITNFKKTLNFLECFPNNESTLKYLESKVPKSLNQEGDILSQDLSLTYGQHKGVINYSYGLNVPTEGVMRRGSLFISHYSHKDKRLLVGSDNQYNKIEILLSDCHFSEEVLWTEPIMGQLALGHSEHVECWIYPKCFKSAYIVFQQQISILENSFVTIFKKKGRNSKVLLSGKVKYIDLIKMESEKDRPEDQKKITFDRTKDF